ncbi:hypothetical protein BDZ90DRAFT_232539 [Jaminaea rosea]|uniref:Uncharacterized protein n=1 Tax=Jaminaea rosea TaxID=1569628 RepID=A0A316UNW6_9BASI|nr:hypothetical protein BDZ90DRAFT_232539 [Jaminaea rosea]PWN26960.1 hypothetical protein BDZ90DRAFT_232539 [Jaminaea rosea]
MPSTPSQRQGQRRPWYALPASASSGSTSSLFTASPHTPSASASAPHAKHTPTRPQPRPSSSAYREFDEQSWLRNLTGSIKSALKRPRANNNHNDESLRAAKAMRSEPRKGKERFVVDEGVQTDVNLGDSVAQMTHIRAPSTAKQGSVSTGQGEAGHLAAQEMLALAGFADEQQREAEGGVLDLKGVLDARRQDGREEDDEQDQIRPSAPASRLGVGEAEAAPAPRPVGHVDASSLFQQGIDIEEILRRRAVAALQQGGENGENEEEEEEEDDDDDDELGEDEDQEEVEPQQPRKSLIQVMDDDEDASEDGEDEHDEDEEESEWDLPDFAGGQAAFAPPLADAIDEEEDDDEEEEEEDFSEEERRPNQSHIPIARSGASADDVIEIGSSSDEDEEDEEEEGEEEDEEEEDKEDEAELAEEAGEEDEAEMVDGDDDAVAEDEEEEGASLASHDDEGSDDAFDPAAAAGSGQGFTQDALDLDAGGSANIFPLSDADEEDEDADAEEEADAWDEEAAQTLDNHQTGNDAGEDDDEDGDRPDVSIDEARSNSIDEGRGNYEPADPPSTTAMEANQFLPQLAIGSGLPTGFTPASELLPLRNIDAKPSSSAASVASAGSVEKRHQDPATPAPATHTIDANPSSAGELVDLKAQVRQPVPSGPPSIAATEGSDAAAAKEKEKELRDVDVDVALKPGLGQENPSSSSNTLPLPGVGPDALPPPLATPSKAHPPPPAQPQDGKALSELKGRVRLLAGEGEGSRAPSVAAATIDSREGEGEREATSPSLQQGEQDPTAGAAALVEVKEQVAAPLQGEGEREEMGALSSKSETGGDISTDTNGLAAFGTPPLPTTAQREIPVIDEVGDTEGRAEAEVDPFDAGDGSLHVDIEAEGPMCEEPEEGQPRLAKEVVEDEKQEDVSTPQERGDTLTAQPEGAEPHVASMGADMEMEDLLDLPDEEEEKQQEQEQEGKEGIDDADSAEDDDGTAAATATQPGTKEQRAHTPSPSPVAVPMSGSNPPAARTESPRATQFSPSRRSHRRNGSPSPSSNPSSPVPTSIRGMRKHLRALAAQQEGEPSQSQRSLAHTATDSGDASYVPSSEENISATDTAAPVPDPARQRIRFRHRHMHGHAREASTVDDEPELEDHVAEDEKGGTSSSDEEARIAPPTTRSHCGFEKLALRVPVPVAAASSSSSSDQQEDIILIVPLCSIRHDRLQEEGARALGRASKRENREKVEVEADLLEEETYHRLARLIGQEMLGEAWILPDAGNGEGPAGVSAPAVSTPAKEERKKGHKRARSSQGGGGDRDWLPHDSDELEGKTRAKAKAKAREKAAAEHPGFDADLSFDTLEGEEQQQERRDDDDDDDDDDEEVEEAEHSPPAQKPRRTPSRSAKQGSVEPTPTKTQAKAKGKGKGRRSAAATSRSKEQALSGSPTKRDLRLRRSTSVKPEDADSGARSPGPSTRATRRRASKDAELQQGESEPEAEEETGTRMTRSRSAKRM